MNAQTARKIGGTLVRTWRSRSRARVEAGDAPTFVMQVEEDDVIDLSHLADKLPPHLPQPGPTGAVCAAALELARATPSLDRRPGRTRSSGPVRRELARHKREAGQYDFDDMLSLVDEALRGPRADALVAAMRERWRYALIDEFQDTDETQWSIFRRAFFEPGRARRPAGACSSSSATRSSRSTGSAAPTWRRTCGRATRCRGPAARACALDDNYRATPALVEAHQRRSSTQGAAAPFFTGSITYAPVACGRPDSPLVDGDGRAPAPVHALRFEREVALPALGALDRARDPRRSPTPRAPWRLDGEAARTPATCSCSRAPRARGASSATALRAAGVPHAFFKEEGLFQTDEAREIRTLLARDRRSRRPRAPHGGVADAVLRPAARGRRARAGAAGVAPATSPGSSRGRPWPTRATSSASSRASCATRASCGARSSSPRASASSRTTCTSSSCCSSRRAARARTLRDLVHALSGLIDETRLAARPRGQRAAPRERAARGADHDHPQVQGPRGGGGLRRRRLVSGARATRTCASTTRAGGASRGSASPGADVKARISARGGERGGPAAHVRRADAREGPPVPAAASSKRRAAAGRRGAVRPS